MRLLEPVITVLVTITFLLLWILIGLPTVFQIVVLIILLGLFGLQIINKIPWTIAPVWITVGFIAVILVINIFQPINLSKLWIIPEALLILLGALFLYVMPVFFVPKPKGKYEIGVQSFEWEDVSRPEIFADADAKKRKIRVDVYYPADKTEGLVQKPFLENAKKLGPHMRYGLPLPPFVFSQLGIVKTNAWKNARIHSEGAFPLIIVSHGLGTPENFNTQLIEELASQGYVVAAINHTYSSIASCFSDDEIIPFVEKVPGYSDDTPEGGVSPAMDARLDQWVEDMQFVLDKMTDLNQTLFCNQLDLAHVGALGHSFGGNASANVCVLDDRFGAFAILDGTWSHMEHINKSALIFEGNRDILFDTSKIDKDELTKSGMTIEEYVVKVQAQLDEEKTFFQSWPYQENPLYFVKIGKAAHYDFVDTQMISPFLKFLFGNGKIPAEKMTTILNTCTLAFFDRCFKEHVNTGIGLESIGFEEAEISRYPSV